MEIGAGDEGEDGTTTGMVEQCYCPNGYKGLSCEDCAPGFTRLRAGSGALGSCVPCMCEGRSNMCHPDTGVCMVLGHVWALLK